MFCRVFSPSSSNLYAVSGKQRNCVFILIALIILYCKTHLFSIDSGGCVFSLPPVALLHKVREEQFDANISGKNTGERFVKMTANYKKEQKELLELVADSHKKPQTAEQSKIDLKLLMKALRAYTDIRQLTPEIVNALIWRIEVHSKDKGTKG